MLGDISLKRQQNDQALKMYSKSLEYNAANVNSLVGKGVIVAAGAVVTKDITDDFVVVAGIPAQIVKRLQKQ